MRESRADRAIVMLVWAAMSLNFFLAMINANVVGLNNGIVTACQLLLTLAALPLIFIRPVRNLPAILGATVAIIVCYVAAGLYNQDMQPKALYDVLLFPLFIALGTTMRRFPVKLLDRAMFGVLLVAAVEMVLPALYTAAVNPLSYYKSTRVWVAVQANEKMGDTGLYGGSERAGGSFFSFISDHRVGSIFLEPVSLGYFALVAAIIYSVSESQSRSRYTYKILICLFLSLIADSRIPSILIIAFYLINSLTRRPPLAVAYLAPVIVFIFAGSLYGIGGENMPFRDILFRLSLTFGVLAETSLTNIIFGSVPSDRIGDSGALYIIKSLGSIGSIILIYTCSGTGIFRWRQHRSVPLLVAIYVSTALLFGGALFSIKTVALLGVFIGAVGAGASVLRLQPEGDEGEAAA
jgi:putative polymerase